MNPREVLNLARPVMPVANFHSASHAQACAELFADAGVPAIEVTLRSREAQEYFRICRQIMTAAQVGLGTVTNKEQLQFAIEEADFAISPGLSPALVDEVPEDFCYIPGIATASELMQAVDRGFETLKLFPASIVGGAAALKAFGGPFPSVKFCPTGGISLANMQDYLALENVLCVGGSWLIPSEADIRSKRQSLLDELGALYSTQQ